MAAGFLRNVVLARLIGIEDMGIAAILGMTVSTLEQIADSGISRYVVQATGNGRLATLGTAHLYSVFRGIGFALLMLSLAGTLAAAFSIPHVRASFLLLALVPFVRGWTNLDVYHQQRKLQFKASNWMELAGQVAALFAAVIGAMWLQDYRAMVLALIAQCSTSVAASHLLSSHRFALRLDKRVLGSIAKFGIPLVLNGVLLAITINGDRMVMATSRSISSQGIPLAEFAAYSIGYALLFTVVMGALRVATNMMLPALANVREKPRELQHMTILFAQSLSGFACCLTIVFGFGGQQLIVALYGADYYLEQGLLVLLVVSLSLRALRSLPTAIAMSHGNTWNTLFANCFRSLALPLSVGALILGFGMRGIVLANLLAELVALGVSILLVVRSRFSKANILAYYLSLYGPVALFTLVATCCDAQSRALNTGLALAAAAIAAGSFYLAAPELRAKACTLYANRFTGTA